ncbi:hypothetical protein CMV_010819 [Castanea mollissima]|uniref:Uncharacterized protein n=1 Tax=Castanea mollissima TaxID=60419 RepID=A0A8J4RMD8_9ROSI|nr:hypothetical protein CMV_010819 [Castanea mollissima]
MSFKPIKTSCLLSERSEWQHFKANQNCGQILMQVSSTNWGFGQWSYYLISAGLIIDMDLINHDLRSPYVSLISPLEKGVEKLASSIECYTIGYGQLTLHNRIDLVLQTHYVDGVYCCRTTKLFIKNIISFYSQMQPFDCDGLAKTLFDILKLVVDVKM